MADLRHLVILLDILLQSARVCDKAMPGIRLVPLHIAPHEILLWRSGVSWLLPEQSCKNVPAHVV